VICTDIDQEYNVMGIAITAAAYIYIVAAAGTGGMDKRRGDGVERVSDIVSQFPPRSHRDPGTFAGKKGRPWVIFGTSRTLSPGKSQCMGTGAGCQGLDVYFPSYINLRTYFHHMLV
jgi:hypothetical protein